MKYILWIRFCHKMRLDVPRESTVVGWETLLYTLWACNIQDAFAIFFSYFSTARSIEDCHWTLCGHALIVRIYTYVFSLHAAYIRVYFFSISFIKAPPPPSFFGIYNTARRLSTNVWTTAGLTQTGGVSRQWSTAAAYLHSVGKRGALFTS